MRASYEQFCRGVPPWAPLLVSIPGAHGGTPLQFRLIGRRSTVFRIEKILNPVAIIAASALS